VRLFGTMSVCVSARPPQPPTDEHNHPSVRLLPVNGAGRRYPCKPTASTTGVLHLSALCRNTAARGGVLAKLELNALGPISRILVDGSEPGAVVLLPRETKVRGRRPTTLVFVSIEYAPALTMLPIELLPPASCKRKQTLVVKKHCNLFNTLFVFYRWTARHGAEARVHRDLDPGQPSLSR
jgi:hypothetical protein